VEKPRRVKKQALAGWLRAQRAERGTEDLAARLAAAFPASSARLRRAALIESGLPLDALVEGVRQDGFPALERTLRALAWEYERGDARRRKAVRGLVITAKTHARLAARNPRLPDGKRAEKREMELWIMTWLENPPLFPAWVQLRKARPDG
jgi:hypothetical protein